MRTENRPLDLAMSRLASVDVWEKTGLKSVYDEMGREKFGEKCSYTTVLKHILTKGTKEMRQWLARKREK